MSAAPAEKVARFAALHQGATPLLMPNAWDIGSAKMFADLGFDAIATTSSGFAATLGRLDGSVTRDEALEHGAALSAATHIPVSADLENMFADEPEAVAETVRLALETGLSGCSIEDYARVGDDVYDAGLAAERVAAAVETAAGRLVLTARAENHLHGRNDLSDTIARLQAYQAAGADVLFAPGLSAPADLRSILTNVDRPVNVLALPTTPPVAELAQMGVKRVSVGGALMYAGLGAVADAANRLKQDGTYDYWTLAGSGREVAKRAFGS